MPEFVMLIGPPDIGQDKYIENINTSDKNYVVISRKNIVEQIATSENKLVEEIIRGDDSYDYPNIMMDSVTKAISEKRNIIFDKANLRPSDRATFLNLVTSDYKKIGVVFDISYDKISSYLNTMYKTTGKVLSQQSIEKAKALFIPPSSLEFNEIIKIVEA